MHTINKEKKPFSEIKKEDLYLTMIGNEEFKSSDGLPCLSSEDNPQVYAKRKNNRTYILKNSRGFFNPIDAYANSNTQQKRNGVPLWKFAEVKAIVFYYYSRFLSTKN